MQKRFLGALALVFMSLAFAGEASALVQRTFVSGLGSDANPCTRTEPCRTFATAIAQTQPGGEVLALDTAGYGPVTITQAISLISPPGVYAGITTTAGGTDAVTVNAGANDVVVLKGLSLSGLGLGNDGVLFNTGRALRVEGLTISGFTDDGIEFAPSTTARMTVTDALIRDNGGGGIETAAPAGQTARVAIDGTRLAGNIDGLVGLGGSAVTVRDSIAAGNANIGFFVVNGVVSLENCLVTDNQFGIGSNGLMRVAGTTVTDNGTGLIAPGGSIFSRGNNTVEGNGTDGTFTGLFAAK